MDPLAGEPPSQFDVPDVADATSKAQTELTEKKRRATAAEGCTMALILGHWCQPHGEPRTSWTPHI